MKIFGMPLGTIIEYIIRLKPFVSSDYTTKTRQFVSRQISEIMMSWFLDQHGFGQESVSTRSSESTCNSHHTPEPLA